MQSILPEIKTKYTFTLIRDDKIIDKKSTHNKMTPYFWYNETYYSGNLTLYLSSDTKEPDLANGTIANTLWSMAASTNNRLKKNTIKYTVTIPASTTYVGTVGSFGISYGGAAKLRTGGQLLDAEGNAFTINKTALDKLIVEIEWEFIFTSGDFTCFEDLDSLIMVCAIFYEGSAFDIDTEFQCCLADSIFTSLLPLNKGIVGTRIFSIDESRSYSYRRCNTWDTHYNTTWNKESVNDHCHKYTETNAMRVSQELLPGRYINTLGIVGLGGIALPNSNVFPTYTLSDIEIGTGDGSSTEFECPIPWFLKDTDKVYKNGVQLTRDVDYSIDYKHNRQKCLSISEGNFAKVIDGCIAYLGSKENEKHSVNIWGSPFIPFAACIDAYGTYGTRTIVSKVPYLKLSTEKPLILDMEKEVEINCFISPYISNSYANKLQLWYSNDNQNYTQACEVSVLKTALNGTDEFPEASVASFETIKARYWKVIITSTSTSQKEFEFPHYTESMTENKVEETKTKMSKRCGFLGYVGEPIKFKTPPAKGDIITMDVSLDRPYKTTQNVIDIAFKYNY